MDCIFCKIINNEIPSNRLFENDRFIAILDAFPANLGHALIIPKKHYCNIFDITDEDLQEAYKIAKYITIALKDTLKIDDFNLVQNNGSIAGQTVFHFHIHVIPRIKNDTVTIHSKVMEFDNSSIESVKNSVVKALSENTF